MKTPTTCEKLPIALCGVVSQSCLAFNLRRADRVLMQIYDDAFRPLGLRSTQFTLLMTIRALEPVPMSELASNLAMDRTTLTRNLKPMSKQGWLVVSSGEDRRERNLSLTPLGHELLMKSHEAWKEAQRQISATFGQKRTQALVKELASLVKAFQD